MIHSPSVPLDGIILSEFNKKPSEPIDVVVVSGKMLMSWAKYWGAASLRLNWPLLRETRSGLLDCRATWHLATTLRHTTMKHILERGSLRLNWPLLRETRSGLLDCRATWHLATTLRSGQQICLRFNWPLLRETRSGLLDCRATWHLATTLGPSRSSRLPGVDNK
ncbi:hypothetical protein J6590_009476 [Homalodisca vitripennis]|nr:hypothetical protein J6590_009476 [Homalodisca vitripennis]